MVYGSYFKKKSKKDGVHNRRTHESEYKAFQDLRSHLIMLKNGLPYFEESIHPVMEVLKVKDKILNQHNKDAYRLGSTYQSRPFELVDTAPLKKAFEADQFKLHDMKKEISKCSKELEHYRYEWQTIIKPPKEMLKDFFYCTCFSRSE